MSNISVNTPSTLSTVDLNDINEALINDKKEINETKVEALNVSDGKKSGIEISGLSSGPKLDKPSDSAQNLNLTSLQSVSQQLEKPINVSVGTILTMDKMLQEENSPLFGVMQGATETVLNNHKKDVRDDVASQINTLSNSRSSVDQLLAMLLLLTEVSNNVRDMSATQRDNMMRSAYDQSMQQASKTRDSAKTKQIGAIVNTAMGVVSLVATGAQAKGQFTTNKKISGETSNLKDLQNTKSNVTQEIKGLQQNIDSGKVQGSVAGATKEKIDSLNQKLSGLEKSIETSNSKITSLNNSMHSSSNRMQGLNQALNTINGSVSGFVSAAAGMQDAAGQEAGAMSTLMQSQKARFEDVIRGEDEIKQSVKQSTMKMLEQHLSATKAAQTTI